MKSRLFRIVCWAIALSLLCPGNAQAQGQRWVYTSVKTSFNGLPGALGDGTHDDTAAIKRALAAGTAIYFPSGTYLFKGRMSVPANTSYRFFGDGPGVSTILFDFDPMGLPQLGIYGSSMGLSLLNVEGLTLMANAASTGTAIEAIFGPTGVGKVRNASIHNVQIRGNPAVNNSCWTRGIHLSDAQDSVIDKVDISGSQNSNTTTHGILSDTVSETASGLQVSSVQIRYCNEALEAGAMTEALHMTGFTIFSCGRSGVPAIKVNSGVKYFHMIHGEVETIGHGVDLNTVTDAKISTVSFKHNGPDDGIMVKIVNSTDVVVSESTFYGAPPGFSVNEYGLQVTGSNSVRIDGNNFSHMQPIFGAGIQLLANNNLIRVTDNLFSTDVSQQYSIVSPSPTPPALYFLGNDPPP